MIRVPPGKNEKILREKLFSQNKKLIASDRGDSNGSIENDQNIVQKLNNGDKINLSSVLPTKFLQQFLVVFAWAFEVSEVF